MMLSLHVLLFVCAVHALFTFCGPLTINNLPLEVLGLPGGGLASAFATSLTNSGVSARVRGAAALPPSDVMTADTYPSR